MFQKSSAADTPESVYIWEEVKLWFDRWKRVGRFGIGHTHNYEGVTSGNQTNSPKDNSAQIERHLAQYFIYRTLKYVFFLFMKCNFMNYIFMNVRFL